MAEQQPESGTRLTAVEIHDDILEPAEKEIERAGYRYGQVAAEKKEGKRHPERMKTASRPG